MAKFMGETTHREIRDQLYLSDLIEWEARDFEGKPPRRLSIQRIQQLESKGLAKLRERLHGQTVEMFISGHYPGEWMDEVTLSS